VLFVSLTQFHPEHFVLMPQLFDFTAQVLGMCPQFHQLFVHPTDMVSQHFSQFHAHVFHVPGKNFSQHVLQHLVWWWFPVRPFFRVQPLFPKLLGPWFTFSADEDSSLALASFFHAVAISTNLLSANLHFPSFFRPHFAFDPTSFDSFCHKPHTPGPHLVVFGHKRKLDRVAFPEPPSPMCELILLIG
jgi:hypothetical protein